ncbi:MAG: hypothetical protein HYT87_07990 [Nitrospirae bacterium]|nr:hypothetical protein [Nitrospirota bacterium]
MVGSADRRFLLGLVLLSSTVGGVLAFKMDLSVDELHRWELAGGNWGDLWDGSRRILGGNVLYVAWLKILRGFSISPQAARLIGLLAHAAAIPLWFTWVLARLGRMPALLSSAWMAASPLHVFESYPLKETSLVFPFVLWTLTVGLGKRLRWSRVALLALAEALIVGFSLTAAPVFAAAFMARFLSTRRLDVRSILQPLPMLVVGALTVFTWDPTFRESFTLFASRMSHDPIALLIDLVADVEAWRWVELARSNPFPCSAPPSETALWVMRGVEVSTGGCLLALLARGLGGGTAGFGRGPVLPFACLAFLPLLFEGAASALRGHFVLYQARGFLYATPFLYAILAQGVTRGPADGWRRWSVLAAPLLLLSLGAYAMALAGFHPHTLRPLGAWDRKVKESIGDQGRIFVHPSIYARYIAMNGGAALRRRSLPLGPEPLASPQGWLTLMSPLDEMEWRSITSPLTRNDHVLVLAAGLPWRDPHFQLGRDSCREWSLEWCDSRMAIYGIVAETPSCTRQPADR